MQDSQPTETSLSLRVGLFGLNSLLVAGCLAVFWPTTTNAEVHVELAPIAPVVSEWAPPAWLDGSSELAWLLPELDGDVVPTTKKAPRLRAKAAILADLDTGEILFARDPDGAKAVASLTKLTAGLAYISTGASLESEHCVSALDYPIAPGGRSKFLTGGCHEGWEYLGAALVASDNRAATSLAEASGLGFDPFIERMDQVSADLGMNASWSDPAGLDDNNLASARDMLKAVVATASHPDLSVAASAKTWRIERGERDSRTLRSTNRIIDRYDTLAAKTGFTNTAGWCFATVVRTKSGRTLAAVVLDAPTVSARFSDTTKLLNWAESTR